MGSTNTDPAVIHQHDLISPSVPLLRSTSSYTGPKLDKLKANYQIWLKETTLFLTLSGFIGYAEGHISEPGPNEPRAQSNWKSNDLLTAAAICSTIEQSEWEYADMKQGANACWKALKQRHQSEGPIRQVQLLQEALTTKCTKSTPLPTTAQKICAAIDRAYEMGDITADLLKCIALLNSLKDFPHLQTIITRDITASTTQTPFTSTQLRTYLDNEQNLLNGNSTMSPTSTLDATALATTPSKPIYVTCSNCKKNGHQAQYCIASGGGMAGKSIDESRQARRNDKEAKRSKITSTPSNATKEKVAIKVTTLDGKPLTMYVDADTINANISANFAATTEFKSLPSDQVDEAWAILEEEPSTSIDWNQHSQVSPSALNVIDPAPIPLNTLPFWIDTGASVHISPDKSDFSNLKMISPRSVKGVGGSSVHAIAVGNIKLHINDSTHITLHNALYIPNATVRLISVRCLTKDSKVTAHFNQDSCWITDTTSNQVVATGHLSETKNLYTINLHRDEQTTAYIIKHTPNIETWHRRLGHANYDAISHMLKAGLIKGASLTTSSIPPKCDSCILGKQTRNPIPKKREEGTGHRAVRKLEKVWVDLSGPNDVQSRTGNLYVMNIVDDYTSYPWTIPLKSKDEAFPKLMSWQLTRENETGLKVGTYRTDNGELKSEAMAAWLATRGTKHEYSSPHTSAHIGRVERMHRTLASKSRTMRIYANLPLFLWDELYLTASHLHARTPTRSLDGRTPWEAWHERKPDYSYMREIGCRAFVLVLNKHNPKLYERSIECVLIGYEAQSKSYRCYDRKAGKVYSSYHVRFIESYEDSDPHKYEDSTTSDKPPDDTIADTSPIIYHDTSVDNNPIMLPQTQHVPSTIQTETELRRSHRIQNQNPNLNEPSRLEKAIQESRESAARIRQAKDERKRTLQNLHSTTMDTPTLPHPAANDHDHALYTDTMDLYNLLSMLENMTASELDWSLLTCDDDPQSWEEAKASPDAAKWEAGYREELDSLKEMGVYELIPLSQVPKGQKVRKGKPVFHLKRNESGMPVRWKVRVVFKGFEQVYGKDYNKTTSPTARMETWRILLHLAASLGWDAQQIDVKTAFLYGILPEHEIQYMIQPPGFEEPGKEDWVWKLLRGLYGMKQGGRIWNHTMNKEMIGWGFTRLTCESCIYFRKTISSIIITAVHVDDFLSIANSKEENERFKDQMRIVWKIADLGSVRFIVGISVQWHRKLHTVTLSQTALIERIIDQFGQKDANPISTPMDPGLKLKRIERSMLSQDEQEALMKTPYRSLVGCLLYLAIGTRPDISYAVQQLSQFLDSYSIIHWNAAIRVIRYLKGTKDLKLHLGGDNRNILGYTDSDWANCLDTRRSVGGYAFTLGSGMISWNSRKQKTVAASSCEAEYMAAFEAAREAIWLRSLFSGIDIPITTPTEILCDNNAAISLSEDPLLHVRVKHIDIKYHFLRERVQSDEISLRYIQTKDNLADIFTKALEAHQFQRLRTFLGLRVSSSPMRGGESIHGEEEC